MNLFAYLIKHSFPKYIEIIWVNISSSFKKIFNNNIYIQKSLIPDTNEVFIYINKYNSSLKVKAYFSSQEYIDVNRGKS